MRFKKSNCRKKMVFSQPDVSRLCDGGEKKAKNIQFKTNLPNTKPTLNLLLIPHYLKTAVSSSVLLFSQFNYYFITFVKISTRCQKNFLLRSTKYQLSIFY